MRNPREQEIIGGLTDRFYTMIADLSVQKAREADLPMASREELKQDMNESNMDITALAVQAAVQNVANDCKPSEQQMMLLKRGFFKTAGQTLVAPTVEFYTKRMTAEMDRMSLDGITRQLVRSRHGRMAVAEQIVGSNVVTASFI